MTNLVACVAASDEIEKSVWEAIDLAGGFTPADGSCIVIKPNLCTSKKGSGVTTDLEVVKALVNYIRSKVRNCEIIIVEGDSDSSAHVAFDKLGYKTWAESAGVKLKNISEDRVVKLLMPNGKRLRTLQVPETLLFMDYFVSVSCIKRHAAERLTCIWKNQYGCIPDKNVRLDLHPFMSDILYDLNSVYWADLAIVDARVCLEGSGPIEGTPKPVGLIMCSRNPLSADVFASSLVEGKAKKVPSISFALRKGLSDASDIKAVGDAAIKSIHLRYISRGQFLLYRLGMWTRRRGLYLINLGTMVGVLAFALRAQKFGDLAGGKLMPTTFGLKTIWRLMTKFETCERIN
jgi:uncharacterized protein (DUF362 family)